MPCSQVFYLYLSDLRTGAPGRDVVTFEEAKELAKERNFQYLETSALLCQTKECFDYAVSAFI